MIIPSEVTISGKASPNAMGSWLAAALVQVRVSEHRDVILAVDGVHGTEMAAISAAINAGLRWVEAELVRSGQARA